MLLKRVRMVGFKSFADETVIEPGPGITAVVGPNGCGKSNIVDAVKWVLGEKSGRALRGKSMEDVIFLGSETRKQAGMAEVEMIFDNQDRSLGLDQDEVSVGRRIYLSSASEYLLNGKRTTRREIERIFMDTGIGKTAYSIMEQGRMSEILKASPEERRNLFDEAAGVSRIKAERAETLSRLEDTEQNLQRLEDILKSKKDELDHLERQARKTRQYLKLKEYLDQHDRNLRYLNFSRLEEKKGKVDEKLKTLNEKRAGLHDRIEKREKDMETRERAVEIKIEDMHRIDREVHRDRSRMDAVKESLDRFMKDREERKEKITGLKDRISKEEKNLRDIQGKMEAAMQLELDLKQELTGLRTAQENLDREIDRLRTGIHNSVEQEGRNSEELSTLDQEQAKILEELKEVTHELILELEARKRELSSRENSRVELKEYIEEYLRTTHEALKGGKGYGSLEKDLLSILASFQEYESIESEFRSILFGKTGLLARKEEMDRRTGELQERKESLQKQNLSLVNQRKLDSVELEKHQARRQETELKIRDSQVRTESSREAREEIGQRKQESEERLDYYRKEMENLARELEGLDQESEKLKDELLKIEATTKKQADEMNQIRDLIEKERVDIAKWKDETRKERETMERLIPEISDQERAAEGISLQISTMQEDLYNDFQMSIGELRSYCENQSLQREKEESEYRRIKGEIVSLGQFNALAIEEQERASVAYNQLQEQKKDIESARDDIQKLLQEIDDRARVKFMETFEQIQKNFTEVYQTLFGGGKCSLTLTDVQDPMRSGIDIMVQPPGKKNSSITLLSGGEQNMTAIALMFATYLVRPSPFCLLDEIDAPLDDSNVGRFLHMLQGFSKTSQFLMITHNKQSMMASGSIFGVTQEEAGISKFVSVKLDRDGKDAALR